MPAPSPTSLIDVVNTRDRPIGTISRGMALATGANFRTAHVLLRGDDDRLLLQRLASARPRHAGRWGSSVAAYLYAGESYDEAAARRLDEELGLQVTLDYQGQLEMHDESSTKFVALFTGETASARRREPEHIAELRWWSREDIDGSLRTQPELFTPTFALLYRSFLD